MSMLFDRQAHLTNHKGLMGQFGSCCCLVGALHTNDVTDRVSPAETEVHWPGEGALPPGNIARLSAIRVSPPLGIRLTLSTVSTFRDPTTTRALPSVEPLARSALATTTCDLPRLREVCAPLILARVCNKGVEHGRVI